MRQRASLFQAAAFILSLAGCGHEKPVTKIDLLDFGGNWMNPQPAAQWRCWDKPAVFTLSLECDALLLQRDASEADSETKEPPTP